MHRTLEFLLHHGYILLLGWVFAEQLGLPLPSMPLLLAAGALAGTGHLSFFASLFYVMLATVVADSIWYQLGRRKGIKVLQLLCKISLEPDSCVRRTEGLFSKQGARSILLAKFILGLGYIFSGQIERVAEYLASFGGWLLVLLLGVLAAYISYKFVARRRFLRELRISRITVDELKQKLDSGEELVIVDLRHSMEFEADPETIPGAFRMDSKELEEKNDRLPRDREVILYCT